MHNFLKLILAIIFCCALSSCLFDKKNKGQVVVVEPEFKFDLFEALGEPRLLQFNVETVEKQDCANYGLEHSIFITPSQIALTINELTPPSDCEPGIEPAKTPVAIGTLANGSYNLKINLKNTIENTGRLVVNDNSFRVEMETLDGIALQHMELKRIPVGSVWGYVAFDDPVAVGDAPTNFLEDLASLTQTVYLETGYYGYFDIKDDNTLTPKELPTFLNWDTFIYNASGKLNEVKSLLDNYRTGPNGNALVIKLYTWEGEIL